MSLNTVTFDIPSFCNDHNISRSFFYKLLKANKGPKLMRVGKRRMISAESAKAWREKMEQQS